MDASSETVKIAIYNALGTDIIPARPTLEPTMNRTIDLIRAENKAIARTVNRGADPVPLMDRLASRLEDAVVAVIVELQDPPNAQSTIDQKGFDDPLIGAGSEGGRLVAEGSPAELKARLGEPALHVALVDEDGEVLHLVTHLARAGWLHWRKEMELRHRGKDALRLTREWLAANEQAEREKVASRADEWEVWLWPCTRGEPPPWSRPYTTTWIATWWMSEQQHSDADPWADIAERYGCGNGKGGA